MPVPGPLDDLLIVDLSRVLAEPYATMVLGDLGARILKVERPGLVDDSRPIGPFKGDQSAYFASNRGKQSIARDLKDAAEAAVFEPLVARADVLVENYRPGVMDRLGFGWAALHARHPRLIYGTSLPAAGNPVKLSAHADPAVRPGAPGLDADRAAILVELGP